jgi:O-antigen/teichoic acid export membrane protein
VAERVLRGGAWAVVGRLLGLVLGVGINVLLARVLSPADFGRYFVALTTVSFLSILGMLGLNRAVVRFVGAALAKELYYRSRAILRIVLLVGSGSGIVIALLYSATGEILAAPLGLNQTSSEKMLIAVWVGLQCVQQLHVAALRSFQDIRAVMALDASGGVLVRGSMFLAILFLALFGSISLVEVLLATVLALMIGLVLARSALNLNVSPLRHSRSKIVKSAKTTRVIFRRLFKTSVPLMGAAVAFSLLNHSMVWILAAFSHEEVVALFTASFRLGTIATFLALCAAQIVPPIIAELYSRSDIETLRTLLQTISAWSTLFTLIVIGLFIAFGEPLLSLLYGDYYGSGALVLTILSFGWLVSAWAGQAQDMLMMSGHEKAFMAIVVLATALGITLSMVMVRPFGAEGIAFAWVISITLQNLTALCVVRKRLGIWAHPGAVIGKLSLGRGVAFGRNWKNSRSGL